jgi:nicotinamide-nucleotide amidase
MPGVIEGAPAAAADHAVVLSTGDELTTGRIADTNAAFLADSLHALGIEVVATIVVGDDPERIAWAWRTAMAQADVVIATGGLGPTADDLTTETLARVVGRRLVRDPDVGEHIRGIFAATGRTMPSNNLKQAEFPESATVIANPLGTAPGYRLELVWPPRDASATGHAAGSTPAPDGARKHLVVLPGVPREMTRMWTDSVVPWLREVRGGDTVCVGRTFQTFGLSESGLDELVRGAVDPAEARVSFRASFPEISVRLRATGRRGEVEGRLERAAARLRARIAEYVYGEADDTMEGVVGRLLRERGWTIAVAESCTAGLIAHRITNVPGSSDYFLEGAVCYSNAAKRTLLGVRAATLAAHGAVSEETAREMAEGVRRLAGSDLGLATTGIAGPGGGTPEKPVGTVCVSLASPDGAAARRYQLWGARDWVKLLASQLALDWVRRHALGLPVAESGIAGGWERTPTDAAAG